MTFTFFTSARRSFFLTGLSFTSAEVCCDLDSADSLPDSECECDSDSEELFDSELWDLLLSLPCSLSDWLPDSDAERLDSSEAELLQEQEHVHSFDFAVQYVEFNIILYTQKQKQQQQHGKKNVSRVVAAT